ncbi:hypothetical protein C8J57DRAFT_1604406 [Mycena rebaudengoi]|nr:hypothetical protein C8J57DRAFT_1604406 [Mycena rebaudengoi]
MSSQAPFASNQPQVHGRGSRPSRVTAGLASHKANLKKKADAATKRNQTISQKQQTPSAQTATPTGPATSASSATPTQPATPASSATPTQPATPAQPTMPALFVTPVQSAPLSTPFSFQSPLAQPPPPTLPRHPQVIPQSGPYAPGRSPLHRLSVPQLVGVQSPWPVSAPSHGQQYPDIGQGPPTFSNAVVPSRGLTAVNGNEPEQYPDFAPTQSEPGIMSPSTFNTFFAHLTAEKTAQFLLAAGIPFDDPDPGDSANTGASGDGNCPDGGGDGDDEDQFTEPPWNQPAVNPGEEEAPPEVTMQDVQIRRKRPREKQPECDVEDDATPSKPSKKTKTGKSRSITNIDEQRKKIVEKAYDFLRIYMATETPWPAPSAPDDAPKGTPSEVDILVLESWAEACVTALGLTRGETDDFPIPTKNERDLIRSRISQFRGLLKTAVRALIAPIFGFIHIADLDEPTAENIASTTEKNRALVADLLRTSILTSTFHYKDPKNTSLVDSICRNPIFQRLLNTFFFGLRQKQRGYYFRGFEQLPYETLAFLMGTVVAGIDEWKTGRYVAVDFDFDSYAARYNECLEFLEEWDKFSSSAATENLAAALACGMLRHARTTSAIPMDAEKVSNTVDTRALALSVFSANQRLPSDGGEAA